MNNEEYTKCEKCGSDRIFRSPKITYCRVCFWHPKDYNPYTKKTTSNYSKSKAIVTKHCGDCGTDITGVPGLKYCKPCRHKRNNECKKKYKARTPKGSI